jgi:hypothetical protein
LLDESIVARVPEGPSHWPEKARSKHGRATHHPSPERLGKEWVIKWIPPPKEARDQAPLGTKPSKRVPATKEIAPSVPPSVHFSSDLADPVVAATVTETISDLEWNTSQSNMHEILRTGFFLQTLITKFKSEEVACSRNTNTTELGTSLNWQD